MDEFSYHHQHQHAPGSPRMDTDNPQGILLPHRESCEVDSLPEDMGALRVKPIHVSSPLDRMGYRPLGVYLWLRII